MFRHGSRFIGTWNRIFKGYKFSKKLFLFSKLFLEKRKYKKYFFYFYKSLEIHRGYRDIENPKTILDDGDFASVWPRTAIEETKPIDELRYINGIGFIYSRVCAYIGAYTNPNQLTSIGIMDP